MTNVSTVLEAAMVMGWFVALLVGEQSVSRATDARRAAEDAADDSATVSSSTYCLSSAATAARAGATPSVTVEGVPDAKSALAAIAGLGVGAEPTYASFVLPHLVVSARGQVLVDGHTFVGDRRMGCLERPLDMPGGSLSLYRMNIWVTTLMGYGL